MFGPGWWVSLCYRLLETIKDEFDRRALKVIANYIETVADDAERIMLVPKPDESLRAGIELLRVRLMDAGLLSKDATAIEAIIGKAIAVVGSVAPKK